MSHHLNWIELSFCFSSQCQKKFIKCFVDIKGNYTLGQDKIYSGNLHNHLCHCHCSCSASIGMLCFIHVIWNESVGSQDILHWSLWILNILSGFKSTLQINDDDVKNLPVQFAANERWSLHKLFAFYLSTLVLIHHWWDLFPEAEPKKTILTHFCFFNTNRFWETQR